MSDTIIGEHPPSDGQEWDCQCARCGSSVDWADCENCTDGFVGHDCGEDCCSCADPEPNEVCEICDGRGGWHECLSSFEFCNEHPLPGRENTKRGKFEWFVVHSNPCEE